MAQINESGHRAAKLYDGLQYWDFNWRKGGGAVRMIETAKCEAFYQQEYCGGAYSLRDTNAHRRAMGRQAIQIGTQFHRPDPSD